MPWKTQAVADMLGVPYHRLFAALRARKFPTPGKDSSGDYIWSEADVENARKALTERGRKPRTQAIAPEAVAC